MADDIGAVNLLPATRDIFSPRQSALLADNLDPKNVKKLNSGSKAQYIEGWHAIAEANRIFGFGAWDRELVRCEETNREIVEVTQNNSRVKQWRVGYLYTVRIIVHGPDGEIRRRDGTGFGTGYAKPEALGEAIESAAKEAETDAMKRALMTFGNPFGLALYDKAKASVGPSLLDDEDENAGPSDAGEREQPKAQQGTGAGSSPPDAAPVNPAPAQPMSKANARADFKAMVEEIRDTQTKAELVKWMKDNTSRVALQPEDWRPEIRKECEAMLQGFAAIAAAQQETDKALEHGNAR